MEEKEEPLKQLPLIQGPTKPNIFSGLPKHLKEPDHYDKIRLFLFDILASRCDHSTPSEWYSCQKCLKRIHDFKEALKQLGFSSPAQYYQWRKVHEQMKSLRRDPLAKYDD